MDECTEKDVSALFSTAPRELIGVGVFAEVYAIVKEGVRIVRKVPVFRSDDVSLGIKSIERERDIYRHLGNHPRVIKCLASGDLYVDLEFAPNGHIAEYLKAHNDTPERRRIQFAQQVIEAVVFVHSKGIIHSDLAARQFLVDGKLNVYISDFGFSAFGGGDVLGFENSSHHLPRDIDNEMPSTIQSDLFALGSTLYEIMTGKTPYEGQSDDAILHSYSNGLFPDVKEILCGHIIKGCWQGRFISAVDVLEEFLAANLALVNKKHGARE